MAIDLAILYRGDLESCNYACGYCPFAKRVDSRELLESDARALARFVDWIERRSDRRIGVLFTPWGEALIRAAYRESFVALSRLPQVARVAAQTNLSFPVEWLREADRRSAALWCTYHPTETSRDRFLAQCAALDEIGVRYSVGVVGLREHFDEIAALRKSLPEHVYLWVNAFKRREDYYAGDEARMLESLDPLFRLNLQRHASLGRACGAGLRAISVDARGTVRRCHFIDEPLGNLYQDEIDRMLAPRACTRDSCGCHIGYVHLDHLKTDRIYGDGLLERIPINKEGKWPIRP